LKPTLTGALTIAAVCPLTAPVAGPIAVGVALTGGAIAGIGHVAEDDDFKKFGEELFNVGNTSHEMSSGFNADFGGKRKQ
jgi:hypothetical protein